MPHDQSWPWLVGEDFTVGDLNVAAVLSPSRTAHIDLRSPDQPCRHYPSHS